MTTLVPAGAVAQESAADLARKLQDPLATVAAIMTDNSVDFGQGEGNDTGYQFQIQPVYSIPMQTVNVIPRAIVPIVGAPSGANFALLADPAVDPDPILVELGGGSRDWGVSDIVTQLFISPKGSGDIKFGLGPQVSWRTRTDAAAAGAGWGAGPSGVIVANAGQWSFAGITGHIWGQDGFNTTAIQPMLYYNFESIEGASLAYNNTIAIDWSAPSEDRWTVPLGLTFSQVLPLSGGYALETSLGAYGLVARPDGAADWQIKWAVNLMLPHPSS